MLRLLRSSRGKMTTARIARLTLPAAMLAIPAPAAAQDRPPASLPAVVAEAARTACPNHDEPAARTVWEAMRARYSVPADSLSLASRMRTFTGRVSAERVGVADVLPRDEGWRGYTAAGRRLARRRIEAGGYAARAPNGWGGAWMYAALDAEEASHFGDPLFAARNTLSLSRSAEGMVIAFCPRRELRRQPAIEGRLILSADTSLAEAEWRFRTPEPAEDAGGRVVFMPHEPGAPLRPRTGVSYLRDGAGYSETVREYLEWRWAADPDSRTLSPP
jgi:hypothetical protein